MCECVVFSVFPSYLSLVLDFELNKGMNYTYELYFVDISKFEIKTGKTAF